ncbi:TlpA family protein disulfide reductase [Edaphobacter sp.]|uniref:TlpA family protein disulfide reductase n=1 Tax=Edaphobacter sp. TaxID=1934404 RepID=UPI002DBC3713|nr:redoxin domain-containing protein [Edaphobacter sp.]HEU5342289.1 redoxin domain-containing protein [Edaphobacter sp.]
MRSWNSILQEHIGTSALCVVLIASLVLNVYLAKQVRTYGKYTRPYPLLKVNASVPPSFPVEDVNGRELTIAFADDQRPTVLYILSPLCGWCKRNESNMLAVNDAAMSRFRFIGLSVDSTNLKQYVADRREPFPVYLLRSKEVIEKFGLYGTPETIVVSPSAKVMHLWQGAYLAGNRKQIEQFFNVVLPTATQ